MNKITWQQVAIIGTILTVLVVVGIYFGLIRPLNDRMAAADAKYDQNHTIALQRPQAEADRRKAEVEVREAQAAWRRYEARFMPRLTITNLLVGMQQRWNEQTKTLGPLTTKFLRADNTVRIVSANIAVPAPPTNPNEVNVPVVVIPLGQVTVSGTFENVLRHAARWNRFRRLVLVDGLSLSGNSPRLNATYTLTAYLFTQGDQPGPQVPQATGGAGGGGFGGPGGPPPGMGGPPGGFGGPGGPPPGMGGPPGGFGGPGGPPPGMGGPPGDPVGPPPGL